MRKKQKEKLIKEFRNLHENNIIPQEHLIKMLKIVVLTFASPKDDTLYHDLLTAVGMPYKDELLKGWEDLVQQAARGKAGDGLMYSM